VPGAVLDTMMTPPSSRGCPADLADLERMIAQLEQGVAWLRAVLSASSAPRLLPSASLLLHDMQALLSDLSRKRKEVTGAGRVAIGGEPTSGRALELLSARLAGTIVTSTKDIC
jgi:hypothetical protein